MISDYIMPICVDGFSDPTHGVHANVSGFGDTKNRAEGENFQASETLNAVDVKIVGKEICQNWYSGDHTIQPDQICAGHEAGCLIHLYPLGAKNGLTGPACRR